MTKACPQCDGVGTVTCDACRGSGVHRTRDPLDILFEKCDKCNGEGKLTCPVCQGSGEVETD